MRVTKIIIILIFSCVCVIAYDYVKIVKEQFDEIKSDGHVEKDIRELIKVNNIYARKIYETDELVNNNIKDFELNFGDFAKNNLNDLNVIDQSLTGPVLTALNDINTIITTISTVVDTVSAFFQKIQYALQVKQSETQIEMVNALNTIESSFNSQKVILEDLQATVESIQTSEEAILTELQEQTTVLNAIRAALEGLDEKIIAVVDATDWEITSESLEGVSFTGDACEYDPFGVGPITCEGYELVAYTTNAKITSV